MELDQQIITALRERADTRAPVPPSLTAIRTDPGLAIDISPWGPSRRLVLVAAALVLLAGGALVWTLGGGGNGSVVRAGNPSPVTETTAVAETTDQATTTEVFTGPQTGWYVPGPLAGWKVEKAVAQAADGKGEAQLWLVDPRGATVIVSIKLPNGGPSQPTDADLHPLPGTTRPAYLKTYRAEGGRGGSTEQEAILWADWPGATLIADVAPPPGGELSEHEAVDLLDAVMSGLHQTDTETWRAFLDTAGEVDRALLEAESLDDLPDGPP